MIITISFSLSVNYLCSIPLRKVAKGGQLAPLKNIHFLENLCVIFTAAAQDCVIFIYRITSNNRLKVVNMLCRFCRVLIL